MRNAVTLVWGSLRLAPIRLRSIMCVNIRECLKEISWDKMLKVQRWTLICNIKGARLAARGWSLAGNAISILGCGTEVVVDMVMPHGTRACRLWSVIYEVASSDWRIAHRTFQSSGKSLTGEEL